MKKKHEFVYRQEEAMFSAVWEVVGQVRSYDIHILSYWTRYDESRIPTFLMWK